MSNVARFMRLFRGYEKRHGRYIVEQQEDSGKYTGQARTVDLPPQKDDYAAHITGERGIGIIPLTSDNRCYFAALDIDEYPVDHLAIAWAVRDMPLFVTRSKSNGAHIWLFIPNGASAEIVVRYMKRVAGELGYGGCEIFPKQTRRASVHDVGNWINLPFFGKSRLGVVVDSEENKRLLEMELPTWLDFVESNIADVTEEQLDERAPRITGSREKKGTRDDFIDGPPCLERIQASKQQEGGRNTVLTQAVMYLARKYASPDEIETRAVLWNQAVYEPPLPLTEVRAVVKSVLSKDYGYLCNQQPMAGFCDRSACLRRAFGIGSRSTDLPFEIGGFSKLLTQPPMYGFNADGKRVLLPNVRALSNQKEFRNYLIDAISKVMPLLQQAKFDELLQGWLFNCEDVEMAPDADFRIGWADSLTEFVEDYKHAKRDRLASGSCWIDHDEGLVYFRMQDFKAYLRKQRVNYVDAQLALYMQEELLVKFHKKGTTVDGKSVRLYSVPLEKLDLHDPTKPQEEREIM